MRANTVAAEPPVRNCESHQSGQTGATFLKLDYLFSFSWIQPIEFPHRDVFCSIFTDNIDLICSMLDTIHNGIRQSLQTGTRKTEYLIVGAGAAGCTVGYLLKKAGADVLLLKMQDARKRFKLCAGILENRAAAAFHDIFGETVEEAGMAPMSIEKGCAWNGNYEFKRAMPGRSPVTREAGESVTRPHRAWGILYVVMCVPAGKPWRRR